MELVGLELGVYRDVVSAQMLVHQIFTIIETSYHMWAEGLVQEVRWTAVREKKVQ